MHITQAAATTNNANAYAPVIFVIPGVSISALRSTLACSLHELRRFEELELLVRSYARFARSAAIRRCARSAREMRELRKF